MLTRSITYHGITWGFTHDVSAGQYINGDWWALASINGGIELSSISPSCILGPSSVRGATNNADPLWTVKFDDRNGSMINPHFYINRYRGYPNSGGAGGFDSKTPAHGFHGSGVAGTETYLRDSNWAAINTGSGYANISNSRRKTLRPGESLVSCDSTVPNNHWGPRFDCSIRRQAILTCVTAAPDVNDFRPPYSSSGVEGKQSYFNASDVQYEILNNINASAVSSLAPSSSYFNYFTSALKNPSLVYAYEGMAYGVQAAENTMSDGYSQVVALYQNTAMAYINTNLLSTANKALIANYLIQRGIDIYGSLKTCYESQLFNTLGFPRWTAGGGGHGNSYKASLIFLLGILKPGAKKEAVRSLLNTLESYTRTVRPIFQEDAQLYEVSSNSLGYGISQNTPSRYSSVSSQCTYQASDVGSVAWRRYHEIAVSSQTHEAKKLWSSEEVQSVISAIPGYTEADIGFFWNSYRQCCTAIVWAPLMFAFKAMGIEKLLANPNINRYTSIYNARQKNGPYPHRGSGNTWLINSTALNIMDEASNSYSSIGSISTEFANVLFDAYVKPAFKGGSGTYLGATPVSGVESICLPTASSIYLDCSTPFVAGQTNIVFCKGLSVVNNDFMWLYVASKDQWLESNKDALGVKYIISGALWQFPFTTSVGSSVASISIPIPGGTQGQEYVAQALIITSATGQPVVYSTNALKFRII
jgi:hypothetical protein